MIATDMQQWGGRSRALRRAAGTVAMLAGVAACSDNGPTAVVPPITPANSLFTSYVALGNSITAGFQSGGITDSTQQQSYAALLAKAMNTRYAYPSLLAPGCPPPIVNFQTQARLAGGTSATCALRNPASVTTALNNVAVPGATSIDPMSPTSPSSNQLTTFVLGGKTQVQKAADANPTFTTMWIGNNDALTAAITGLLTANATFGSAGLTDSATFKTRYAADVAGLKAIGTIKGAVLIGVVQTGAIPILFPAAALFNPAFKAGFDQFAGATTTLDPSCTPTTTSLISFQLAGAIRGGNHPPIIACAPTAFMLGSTGVKLGDAFVLDAGEQAKLAATVTAYNNFIASQATANNWAYLDPNPLLASAKASGCITTVPNLASATQTFGSCISLDGVHPSGAAHKLVANALVTLINSTYKTSLPAVP